MKRGIAAAIGLMCASSLWAQEAKTSGSPGSAPAAATQAQPTDAADQAKIAKMQAQLQDWPDLGRYHDEDAALPQPSAGEQRVVFMGDSITDGWGRRPGTGQFFPGNTYINRGISGQTTPQMLIRFQQDVVALHPAAVVILAGTNDIAGNTGPSTPQMIEDNFVSMADIATASGIKVILASITPAYAYPWKPGAQPAAEIRELNTWIAKYCADHGYTYLDYYDSLVDGKGAMLPGDSFDGVHPTEKGYALMTPLAEQAIAKALGK
jgi:lysophospholipase L1-like esterase